MRTLGTDAGRIMAIGIMRLLQFALCNLCGHKILYASERDYLVEEMLHKNLLV